MIQRFQVYKCGLCGNIVEALFCRRRRIGLLRGKMELLENKTEDAGYEKACPGRGKNRQWDKNKNRLRPSSDGRKSII